MATVRAWALHGNIQNAIDYVLQDSKTEKHLTYIKGATASTVGLKWKADRDIEKQSVSDIVGFHFQQSFEAGSISLEEAMEIGKQWIEEILGDEYEYVLAVHKDTNNVHTHFIVNPKNTVTGKQKRFLFKRDVPCFKDISDRICIEHGKSVLEKTQGRGKTYYEWLKEKQGDSQKEIIMKTLDTLIPKVHDYQDLKKYLIKMGYEVEDNLDQEDASDQKEIESDVYRFSANEKLFIEEKETPDSYFIRVPNTSAKKFIMVPKEYGIWTNDKKTYFVSIPLDKNIPVCDRNGNVIEQRSMNDIKVNWEDKAKKKKERLRNGLRIKPPLGGKFIRCSNIGNNNEGEGYSLEEVLRRIDENNCLRTDQSILDVINNNQAKDLNVSVHEFYKTANIKISWKDSVYYAKSRKQRYIEYKVNDIQKRLDEIHQRRESVDDILNITSLKRDREELHRRLKDIYVELEKEEKMLEKIYVEVMSEQLQATSEEMESYYSENIVPLKEARDSLKKEIAGLTKKIDNVQNKINQENKQKEQKEGIKKLWKSFC